MDFLSLTMGYVLANLAGIMLPAFVYFVGATVLALILGWGSVGFEDVGNTKVLKMPGGAILASLPIPEVFMLGIVLMSSVLNPAMTWLATGLSFFIFLRLMVVVIVHFLAFVGSISARGNKMNFSLECMDSRCTHGSRSGNFLHNWACGGFTLLTALGLAPFVLVPVLTSAFVGWPAGTLGIVLLVLCCLPWPFVIGKLLAPAFSDSTQVVIKGAIDTLMFVTEFPGWIIGSITLSWVSWRMMWPGITSTELH